MKLNKRSITLFTYIENTVAALSEMHEFHGTIDKSLVNVDPYDASLDAETKAAIITESKNNPWYFFHNVVKGSYSVADIITEITPLNEVMYNLRQKHPMREIEFSHLYVQAVTTLFCLITNSTIYKKGQQLENIGLNAADISDIADVLENVDSPSSKMLQSVIIMSHLTKHYPEPYLYAGVRYGKLVKYVSEQAATRQALEDTVVAYRDLQAMLDNELVNMMYGDTYRKYLNEINIMEVNIDDNDAFNAYTSAFKILNRGK